MQALLIYIDPSLTCAIVHLERLLAILLPSKTASVYVQMKNKNHKGFTLYELMTVTAIIGLFISVAVPAFVRYTDRAKFSIAILATNTYKQIP